MTYSIIGIDKEQGEIGVLLASFYYGCAPRTLVAAPGVGAVVMQMVPDMEYGIRGTDQMAKREDPSSILASIAEGDSSRSIRQVTMMNSDGLVAAFTGEGCVPSSGHLIGVDCCAQGAMVADEHVWIDMVREFERTAGALPERLIAGMRAGEAAGGDIRGRRAAAMLVVSTTLQESYVRSHPINIRVDDHADPLAEVVRHLAIQRRMAAVELAFERGLAGDVGGSIEDYAEIARSAPDDPDVTMRFGIMLGSAGRIEEAVQQLSRMTRIHAGWGEVPARLIAAGLLPDDPRIREISK